MGSSDCPSAGTSTHWPQNADSAIGGGDVSSLFTELDVVELGDPGDPGDLGDPGGDDMDKKNLTRKKSVEKKIRYGGGELKLHKGGTRKGSTGELKKRGSRPSKN